MAYKDKYSKSNLNKLKSKEVDAQLLKDVSALKKGTTGFGNSVKSSNIVNTNDESLSDVFRSNYPTYSYAGGSGGGGMSNISNILKAYEQGAESNRAVAKQTYESKRSDLLTSLKRFQEQNAKDVERTQRAYLSDQASLESAIAQADRQNRINASARGLGGSGLQQLSQLQNLLSQGQTISDMATENQDTLEKLRTALANEKENTNKSLKDILDVYNNTLSSINSDLAANKANIEYQAREAAANRAASANSAAAQIAAQNAENEAAARADEKAFKASLSKYQKKYSDALGKATSSKKAKEAKQSYEKSISKLLEQYAIPSDSNVYKSAYNYLTDTYTNDFNTLGSLESRVNLWNYILNPSDYIDAKNQLKQTPGKFRIW